METARDPRAELLAIASSLRALLEFHSDAGTHGFPRAAARSAGASLASPARPAEQSFAIEPPAPHAREPATVRSNPPEASAKGNPAIASRPEVSLQDVSLQDVSLQDVSLQDVSLQDVSLQDVSLQDVSLQDVRFPKLEVLRETVRGCTRCGLASTRTNTVFARGNPRASLCFVGEAPGADEDAQGLPFVGRAGQLLDKMIGAMGLSPEHDVYVCNILKCRPPGNRRPTPDEMAACFPYLHEQLALVQPKVIVALGNTAVAGLLGTTVGITKVRGSWKLYRGKTLVMPTYHPSYLLRPGPQQQEAKRQAWEDLQGVMKELGLRGLPPQGRGTP